MEQTQVKINIIFLIDSFLNLFFFFFFFKLLLNKKERSLIDPNAENYINDVI